MATLGATPEELMRVRVIAGLTAAAHELHELAFDLERATVRCASCSRGAVQLNALASVVPTKQQVELTRRHVQSVLMLSGSSPLGQPIVQPEPTLQPPPMKPERADARCALTEPAVRGPSFERKPCLVKSEVETQASTPAVAAAPESTEPLVQQCRSQSYCSEASLPDLGRLGTGSASRLLDELIDNNEITLVSATAEPNHQEQPEVADALTGYGSGHTTETEEDAEQPFKRARCGRGPGDALAARVPWLSPHGEPLQRQLPLPAGAAALQGPWALSLGALICHEVVKGAFSKSFRTSPAGGSSHPQGGEAQGGVMGPQPPRGS